MSFNPAVTSLLRFFKYDHLPAELQNVSKPFCELALQMAAVFEGPECTAGLRKLLEAKDAFVRCAVGGDVTKPLEILYPPDIEQEQK